MEVPQDGCSPSSSVYEKRRQGAWALSQKPKTYPQGRGPFGVRFMTNNVAWLSEIEHRRKSPSTLVVSPADAVFFVFTCFYDRCWVGWTWWGLAHPSVVAFVGSLRGFLQLFHRSCPLSLSFSPRFTSTSQKLLHSNLRENPWFPKSFSRQHVCCQLCQESGLDPAAPRQASPFRVEERRKQIANFANKEVLCFC